MGVTDVARKAKNIKAAVFDGDGVLFTGRVFIDEKGERLKERSLVDGQGLSLLCAAGIRIAFVTAEKGSFIETVVNKFNSRPSVKGGIWSPADMFTDVTGEGKVNVIDTWLTKVGIKWSECSFMGDDMSDYEILQKVGFPTAPAQAEQIIKDLCLFIAERRGGDGAIRDLTNFILAAKRIDPTKLTLR